MALVATETDIQFQLRFSVSITLDDFIVDDAVLIINANANHECRN